MKIDCLVVRQKILAKVVKVLHISSKHQLAYIFTKSFGFDHIQILLGKMGVNNIYTLS